jgi:hypothetical protein
VAGDDRVVAIDQNRIRKSKGLDTFCNLSDLKFAVCSGVSRNGRRVSTGLKTTLRADFIGLRSELASGLDTITSYKEAIELYLEHQGFTIT